MSEKCLLRLDTKSVMRKSVKDVKAKRHKLQWCACARPREGRGLQHFLRLSFRASLRCFPWGEIFLVKYCSGMFHVSCSIVRGFGINLRCSEKKLPHFLKNLHRFRENLPRFFSSLLRIELHFFWRRERNHEFLGFQIRCVEARKHFMIDIFRISLSSAQQYCVGSQKNPTHRRMNGIFYRSAQCWLPHQGRN